jgi:hypothetical protein
LGQFGIKTVVPITVLKTSLAPKRSLDLAVFGQFWRQNCCLKLTFWVKFGAKLSVIVDFGAKDLLKLPNLVISANFSLTKIC